MDAGWSRNTRTLALAAAIIFVIWIIYLARSMIGPLVVAALLAYVLNPLITFINMRTHLPRSLVVTLFYLLSLTVLVGLSIIFTPFLAQQAQELTDELEGISMRLQTEMAPTTAVLGIDIPLRDILADFVSAPESFVESDRIIQVVNTATTNIVWVAIILIVTFYLLLDWDKLREWMIQLAPPTYQPDVRRLYGRIKDIWQAYLRGQLVLMVVIGLLTGICLAIVGMPGAAALGLLTGILDAILSIGPVIAMLIAALVAWFEGSTYLPIDNTWFVLIVLGIYGLIQALENVWFRPRVMGRQLNMHPAVVFLGIIAALSLVGAVGALIVLPVMGTVGVVGSYLRCRILGLHPFPEDTP